jgi:hypothetical protein
MNCSHSEFFQVHSGSRNCPEHQSDVVNIPLVYPYKRRPGVSLVPERVPGTDSRGQVMDHKWVQVDSLSATFYFQSPYKWALWLSWFLYLLTNYNLETLSYRCEKKSKQNETKTNPLNCNWIYQQTKISSLSLVKNPGVILASAIVW